MVIFFLLSIPALLTCLTQLWDGERVRLNGFERSWKMGMVTGSRINFETGALNKLGCMKLQFSLKTKRKGVKMDVYVCQRERVIGGAGWDKDVMSCSWNRLFFILVIFIHPLQIPLPLKHSHLKSSAWHIHNFEVICKSSRWKRYFIVVLFTKTECKLLNFAAYILTAQCRLEPLKFFCFKSFAD